MRLSWYYLISGIKLYCEQYGAGEPLMLLHGNGGNIGAFAKNIPYLVKKFRVISIDSRAQGKSVDAGDSLSFEMMAARCGGADGYAVYLVGLRGGME